MKGFVMKRNLGHCRAIALLGLPFMFLFAAIFSADSSAAWLLTVDSSWPPMHYPMRRQVAS
jgi:hypothetical protein